MIRLISFVCAFVLASSLCLAGTPQTSTAELSQKMELPQTISDSVPWFAIREISKNALPFTRSHLAKIAEKSDRVAMVYFATWCIPCRAGVKRLVESAEELQKNHVSVVLVNIGERDEELVKSWIKKVGATQFFAVNDPFKRLTEGFGLVKENEEISLPRTIVLDKQIKPLFMLGEEGNDWPQVLWSK